MRDSPLIEKTSEPDTFENVTEEEIISLWQSYKTHGLSADEAWHAIVTGIALDTVFAHSRSSKRVEH